MKLAIEEMGVQVVDHCNLLCKGCLHFCHKGQKPYYYSVERFREDIKRLHQMVDIHTIRLYGGEPLLHPELQHFIQISRCELPEAEIKLLTNGLLLCQMPRQLIDVLKQAKVQIVWSVYPLLSEEKIDVICRFLLENRIQFQVSKVSEFYACFRLEGDIPPDYAFARCNGRNCHVMQDGKISLCPAPMVEKLMKHFGFKGDLSNGLLDIYDKTVTPEQIVKFLHSPHAACSYCTAPSFFTWTQQSDNVSIQDWISK